MINEKHLLAKLKSVYKNGGYRIMENNEQTTITAGGFAVIYQTDRLPRSILGLIAEHTGAIPTDIAFECSPGNGTQIVMREVIEETLSLFICHGECEPIYPTPLYWESRRLFQKDSDRSILAVSSDMLLLLDSMDILPMQMGERNIMRWDGDGEQLYIAAQSQKENLQLASLSCQRWVLL